MGLNFDKFVKVMIRYMALGNARATTMMKQTSLIADIGTDAIRAKMDGSDTNDEPPPGTTWCLSTAFYCMLTSVISGTAALLRNQVSDESEVDTWGLLGARYLKTNKQFRVMLLVKVVRTKFQ